MRHQLKRGNVKKREKKYSFCGYSIIKATSLILLPTTENKHLSRQARGAFSLQDNIYLIKTHKFTFVQYHHVD